MNHRLYFFYNTICSRSKSAINKNFIFYIRKPLFSKKITDPQKNSLYVQYLSALMSTMIITRNPKDTVSTPQPSDSGDTPISNKTPQSSSITYERLIAHATEVKFTKNSYITPITVGFGSSESENSVNLPVKYRKIFITIKFLISSTSIYQRHSNHKSTRLPIGTECIESFDVQNSPKQFLKIIIWVYQNIPSSLQ